MERTSRNAAPGTVALETREKAVVPAVFSCPPRLLPVVRDAMMTP
jgi:hypothetical protein